MLTPTVAAFGFGSAGFLLVGFVMYVVFGVLPAILAYILLDRIPEEHRQQSPALALLLLIPLFSLIWAFFVYPRISDSFQSYFNSRNEQAGDCGHSIALATCICAVCSLIPVVGMLAGLAALVLLVVFFVKAFDLSGRIERATTQPTVPPISPSSPA